MVFTYPVCCKSLPRDLLLIIPHTEQHIVEEIKREHPNGPYKYLDTDESGGYTF